jgi:hypothetical protein
LEDIDEEDELLGDKDDDDLLNDEYGDEDGDRNKLNEDEELEEFLDD